MKHLALPAAMADPTLSLQWARRAALLLMAYYVVGRLSLSIPQVGPQVSLVWPPAGIALAALLRFGPALWPAVWVGALLVAVSTGLGVGVSALMAIGSTAGAAFGAAWMRRLGLHPGLDRRRDLWIFGLVGVATTALSSGNCMLWTAADGAIAWRDFASGWAYWWLGDVMGVAVVGVPLLTVSPARLQRAFAGRAWMPTTALAAAALASAWLAFGAPSGSAVLSPYVFVPPLALCWLAARSGIFAASTVVLAISALAVLATGLGRGPFHAPDDIERSVALLSGYVCALSAMPLLVTALIGEIDATERHWRETFDSAHIGSAAWDLRRGRVEVSARWQAMLGHDAHAWRTNAETLWRRLHPDEAAGVRARLAAWGRGEAETPTRIECRMQRRDGTWAWLELHAFVAEADARGQPLRVVITARDAAEQLAAREQRTLSENLFLHLHEGLLITDAAHRVLEVNPTYCEITGQTRAELIGNVPPLLHELQARRAAESGTAHAGSPWRGELAARRRNGEPCVLQVTVSEVCGPDATLRHHVIAVTDVTQVRAHVDQLQLRTHFDELTRLPNRARLAVLLQGAIESGRSAGTLLTVCCLDLDHFKSVNEHHGPAAGDRLLVEVADRLRRSLRSWAGGDDAAARVGGDEFVLLLHTATLEESRHAVARLLRQVGQPVNVGDTEIAVTASIGATVFPFDRADAETLLRHADHAMYGAKQAGRNGYLFFDAETDRRTEARFVALGRIQEALDAGELCLHYQPKVDLRSGRPVGMEALLRWNHPAEGMVPPAQFLPLIEHTGLGVTVGRWVIQEALAELDRWLAEGLALTLSVNVSARHLQEPAFAAQLEAMLVGYRTPVGAHLVLEVLETAALADIDFTRRLMDACRTLGVRFALDDFGTGYSTFTYLKRLPLDMLKIDRSFVANMLHDAHDLAIVEGVVGLARTFGCSVVAEGVETLEQARGLAAIGCDIGQGHGIAKAMPAEEVAAWVRERSVGVGAWPGA